MTQALLFHCAGPEGPAMFKSLCKQLEHKAPDIEPRLWPEVGNPDEVRYAAVWLPPDGFFEPLTKLAAVLALSAGVERLLDDPHLPAHLPVIRLEDAGMGELMAEYVLYGVLHAHRQFPQLVANAATAHWGRDCPGNAAKAFHIGILGAGVLGQQVAMRLVKNGYTPTCWSRTNRSLPEGIGHCHGDEALLDLARNSQVLVCLLPLTTATRNILDKELFNVMPAGGFVINAARGEHLVDRDLIAAISRGALAGALLDVFREEPLPAEHPFWAESRIIVTPHIAAPSQPTATAAQVVDSIVKLEHGQQPGGLVNRELGY